MVAVIWDSQETFWAKVGLHAKAKLTTKRNFPPGLRTLLKKMYDNRQNHDNDNYHNIFNLSNLLKRETASGWLGTQCRQENDVTWWQGFKKDNDSPIIKQNNKNNTK